VTYNTVSISWLMALPGASVYFGSSAVGRSHTGKAGRSALLFDRIPPDQGSSARQETRSEEQNVLEPQPLSALAESDELVAMSALDRVHRHAR
jgi:hypothetical protein